MILPHLLFQQEEIFLFPCLTAAVGHITYKVPPSSFSCKSFRKLWPWCLNPVPLSLQSSFVWIVCGKLAWLHFTQGVATVFQPIISTVITCQNVNLPSFFYFYFQAFCHTLHEITKYTVLYLIIMRLTCLIFSAEDAHSCNYCPV